MICCVFLFLEEALGVTFWFFHVFRPHFWASVDPIWGKSWFDSSRQTWFVIAVHLLHTNFKIFLPPLLRLVDVKTAQVHLTRPGGMREAIRRPSGRRARCPQDLPSSSLHHWLQFLSSIFSIVFSSFGCLLPPP